MKIYSTALIAIFLFFGWVSGYYRSNGTYVNGYWRSEPNEYKWDNYSWNNDWNDAYNDNTYYRLYGYDPEPWDDDYVSSYSQNSYWNNTYDYDAYDYDWDYDYDYDNWWDW